MSIDTEWDKGFRAAQEHYQKELQELEDELLAANSYAGALFRENKRMSELYEPDGPRTA